MLHDVRSAGGTRGGNGPSIRSAGLRTGSPGTIEDVRIAAPEEVSNPGGQPLEGGRGMGVCPGDPFLPRDKTEQRRRVGTTHG